MAENSTEWRNQWIKGPQCAMCSLPQWARVQVEIEGWRWGRIDPVAGVRKSEREETGFVADIGIRNETGTGEGVDLG